jgi:hypothetical protein
MHTIKPGEPPLSSAMLPGAPLSGYTSSKPFGLNGIFS